MPFDLDYAKMVYLDAEALAEGGIKTAYDEIVPILRQYVSEPAEVSEVLTGEDTTFMVKGCRVEFKVAFSEVQEDEIWAKATNAFFAIVNGQLTGSEYRLYAVNGGNDLGCLFLTQFECNEARRSLKRKEDWPYLPTLSPPWYGSFHG